MKQKHNDNKQKEKQQKKKNEMYPRIMATTIKVKYKVIYNASDFLAVCNVHTARRANDISVLSMK